MRVIKRVFSSSGIKGIGGGGKTTLARAIFDHIHICFEGKSFVENVREVSKVSGLKELQKQILKDVVNDQSIDVTSVYMGKNMMRKKMCSRKALVILDDVDDIDQLEALAGDWFKPGSRIIITTRDEQVLIAQRVNIIHDVNLLSDQEAICLFSRYAFGREIPIEGYKELAGKVVQYAVGLPLTIKVLGSHLYGRTKGEWVDAINRLKKIPLKETLEKLELSYNGLENDQKEIFLDVVCILKGEMKDYAIRILESCGLNAEIGLRVLEQKSLITVSDTYGLRFHDHIEEMGKNIVRRFHPDEPSKHSRLWIAEEIEDILLKESGTEATRSIKLSTDLHPTIIMKGLKNMRGLRFLYVNNGYTEGELDEASQFLPKELQSLHWPRYPFRFLPKKFQANKLVNLEMVGSVASELWEGGAEKVLNKIRFLDLTCSNIKTFDIGMTPHVEILNLQGCSNFFVLHMSVVCPKLKFLNLSGSKVNNLNLLLTPNLETLYLRECKTFQDLYLPIECLKLTSLDMSCSKVSNLNLGMTPYLETLDLSECSDFVELHLPIECPNLKFINLSGSKVSNLNLGMTPHIEELCLEGCNEFVELYLPVECPNLKYLDLSGSKVSNINLGMTPQLRQLNLKGCYSLQEIHAPVGCLKELGCINLTGCLRFKKFSVRWCRFAGFATLELTAESVKICPLHPNNNLPKFQFQCNYVEPQYSWSGNVEKLISFGLCACTNMESFSASICGLQRLEKLTLEGKIPEVPKDLNQLESLNQLTLWLKEIKHLPDSICMLKHLKFLDLKACLLLEQLPMDLGRLQELEELDLTACISLQDIPNSICNMRCLKRLHLRNCIRVEKLPEEFGLLKSLENINIEGMHMSHLPQSIFELKGLRIIGSKRQLQSYGFTSFTEIISRFVTSHYVEL